MSKISSLITLTPPLYHKKLIYKNVIVCQVFRNKTKVVVSAKKVAVIVGHQEVFVTKLFSDI